MSSRRITSNARRSAGHENPLGLPRTGSVPMMQRGLPAKRKIPHVRQVIVVASGKGGVGKSTVAVNLALALSRTSEGNKPKRVGLLDLDIFGPSVPKLMALERVGAPHTTPQGALIPLINHGIPCMSMGFLLPIPAGSDDNSDTPIVWRGMMVMKAVQQLLFDVDWRMQNDDLDLLVIDTPPGTGDVHLSLSQLVYIDGAIIVSTPQDVAIVDARKGVAMFRKVGVPILGGVLNMSHFVCPGSPDEPHYIFGTDERFQTVSKKIGMQVLAKIPIEAKTSSDGDAGHPTVLSTSASIVKDAFVGLARIVASRLESA
ncbi:uncharacterized protein L969DRAFT_95773 [Mixia osmundae IAM 14324]|uniref:P-loop containing nucleoside triphosphate hydrolase protein n=1 Tax=Mixia osmundae (strain CBS 9802 / IAM 14324 / JCM 22182 / KY 12970) TaxID=764103 RepID=G7DSM1_MIXOS|nr:uncharacterized protein L969DRAFT_95773 [Mixia osmundae IAM 14324]KEI37923.1 hypothetical protein L969DRAFT_95773 [Mixia osmundae IAM 14324]GAA93581.1 hypothetical protein E5Q_00225 [Mixia osmundae IAM 14324]